MALLSTPPVTQELLASIAREIEAVHGLLSSELVSFVRSQQANGVLWSGAVKLDAGGLATFDYEAPFAAVAFWQDVAAGAVTIATDTPAGAAPTQGPGVYVFPAAGGGLVPPARVFPALGRALTLYGTANAFVGMVAVFSRPQPPR